MSHLFPVLLLYLLVYVDLLKTAERALRETGCLLAGICRRRPHRLWKHKRLIDKNPNLEIEAIAKKEGIDVSLLQDSMHLLEVRNAMPLIEESDENADELECYHDAQADQEHDLALVKQQLAVYSKNIKQRDRLILSIAFDVDMFEGITVSQDELDKEAVRQLYAAQLTTAA